MELMSLSERHPLLEKSEGQLDVSLLPLHTVASSGEWRGCQVEICLSVA